MRQYHRTWDSCCGWTLAAPWRPTDGAGPSSREQYTDWTREHRRVWTAGWLAHRSAHVTARQAVANHVHTVKCRGFFQ